MSAKYDQMCLVVAIGVLSSMLFLVAIRAKVIGNKITVAEWDLNIVTVTDYAVEMLIDEAAYRHWFETSFHGAEGGYTNGVSPGLSLK